MDEQLQLDLERRDFVTIVNKYKSTLQRFTKSNIIHIDKQIISYFSEDSSNLTAKDTENFTFIHRLLKDNAQESIDLAIKIITASIKHNKLKEIIENYLRDLELTGQFREIFSRIYTSEPSLLYITDNTSKDTILHLATKHNAKLLIELLLHADIVNIGNVKEPLINAKNAAGHKPLWVALQAGNTEVSSLLLHNNASFYLEFDGDIYLRSQYQYEPYLPILLQFGQTVEEPYLHEVVKVLRMQLSASNMKNAEVRREYLDRVALRLSGVKGDGELVGLQKWYEIFAGSLSQDEICTLDKCFYTSEGFGISANYLLMHIRILLELIVEQKFTPIETNTFIHELMLAINTAKIDQETLLVQLSPEKNIESHVIGLTTRVKRLKPKNVFSYPAGWPGEEGKSNGHAIYYTLDHDESGLFNLGACLEEGFIAKGLEVTDDLYKPLIMKSNPSEEKIKHYLHGLVWANCFAVDDATISRAKHVIYSVDMFGYMIQSAATDVQAEIIQPVGNCIIKNYLFSARRRLGDELYHKLYLYELNFMLGQIQSYGGKVPKIESILTSLKKNEAVFHNLTLQELKAALTKLGAITDVKKELSQLPIKSNIDLTGNVLGVTRYPYPRHPIYRPYILHRGEKVSVDEVPQYSIAAKNLRK